MSDDDEGDPATKIANLVSECLAMVWPLKSIPDWERFCETVAVDERKQRILGALSHLLGVAPLVELPTVHGPKPMVRRLLAAATDLQRFVAAWDDDTAPSAAMAAAARDFIECMNDPESHLDLP